MTGLGTGWRLALRIARRDALRHRGRSLLVVAMVGLPILAVVGADTLNRTNEVSGVEALPALLGRADARLSGESRGPVVSDPATGMVWQKAGPPEPAWTRGEVAAALPAGSRLLEAFSGVIAYRTRDGFAQVTGVADDLADPLRAGAVELVEGRFATADDEVLVSPAVAERGVSVGDVLAIGRGDAPVRVVGVARSLVDDGRVVWVRPAAARLLLDPLRTFYAAVPGGLDWPAVQQLERRGLATLSREVALDPPPASAWKPAGTEAVSGGDAAATAVLALVAASVVLEVVLLAGPAFAVGVRRQRRELALIGAAGGSPADLRRVVLAGGALLGGASALLGAALGIGMARLAVPVLEARGSTFGPFDVPVRDVLVTVAVGVLAGLGAALVPARQAARTDVVEALAGRRGQVRTSWRSPVLGLVLAAVGLLLVVLGARGTELAIAGGSVVLVVGMVVASPWLVGLLVPLARRLPATGRLALRDATRNRGRTAPAVAAVMATVAGVTALAIGSASDSAQSRRDYVAQVAEGTALVQGSFDDEAAWRSVEELVTDQAPGREVHRVLGLRSSAEDQRTLALLRAGCLGTVATCSWESSGAAVKDTYGSLVIADAGAARALFPVQVAGQVAAALERGTAVVLADDLVGPDGTIGIGGVRLDDGGRSAELPTLRLPAVRVQAPEGVALPGSVVVPAAQAGRLPAPVSTSELVVGGPGDPVTAAQEEQLGERLSAFSPYAGVYVERGWVDRLATPRLVLVVLGSVLVLVATLTATGLALADARPDFATLAAVGAAPRTRRLVAMASAAVVGGTGAVLGLVAGLGPGIAVAYPLTDPGYGTGGHPLVEIPWGILGAVVVLVPLLAVAVTGVAVRSRLPLAARAD